MSRVSDIIAKTNTANTANTEDIVIDIKPGDFVDFSQIVDAKSLMKSPLLNQEIDKPKHYASKSGKDVIDWCEDFGIMQNAYVFNIFKYLCRAGKKDNNSELQDALKAEVYLKRYIESLKNAQ